MPPDDAPREKTSWEEVQRLDKALDKLVQANASLAEQLRAAEAAPKVDLSGYVVRYRVPDVQDFQYVTGAFLTAMCDRYEPVDGESEEETTKRRQQDEDAYARELVMNCVSMGQPGLELWIVDPAKANAVKATGDPSV